jgi:hypothetical protein
MKENTSCRDLVMLEIVYLLQTNSYSISIISKLFNLFSKICCLLFVSHQSLCLESPERSYDGHDDVAVPLLS